MEKKRLHCRLHRHWQEEKSFLLTRWTRPFIRSQRNDRKGCPSAGSGGSHGRNQPGILYFSLADFCSEREGAAALSVSCAMASIVV